MECKGSGILVKALTEWVTKTKANKTWDVFKAHFVGSNHMCQARHKVQGLAKIANREEANNVVEDVPITR